MPRCGHRYGRPVHSIRRPAAHIRRYAPRRGYGCPEYQPLRQCSVHDMVVDIKLMPPPGISLTAQLLGGPDDVSDQHGGEHTFAGWEMALATDEPHGLCGK